MLLRMCHVHLFAAHDIGSMVPQFAANLVVVSIEFPELRMRFDVLGVVHQAGIMFKVMPDLRMTAQEIVECAFASKREYLRIPPQGHNSKSEQRQPTFHEYTSLSAAWTRL